jgi:uncharacterized metal-binding protein YceD (DUF177 family)
LQTEKKAVVVKEFSVDISGLKNKTHSFDFEIDKVLLETFENEVIEDASLSVLLTLQKTETMITATVEMEGTVKLVCDRSLREFDFPVNLKETIYYKFGEIYEELSDEVVTIPSNYAELDFTQFIYDTLVLSIPPKVIHPDLQDEETDEDDGLVFSTADDSLENVDENAKEETTDPRWEKLKNLKFNKN